MRENRRHEWLMDLLVVLAGGAVATTLPLVFGGLAIWWLAQQFGAGVAAVTVGGLLALLAFVGGAVFAYRLSKRTLENAAVFVEDITGMQRATVGLLREGARAEREAFSLRARAELADEARVQRLAEQRARLLMDAERDAASGPTWMQRMEAGIEVEAEADGGEDGKWARWQ